MLLLGWPKLCLNWPSGGSPALCWHCWKVERSIKAVRLSLSQNFYQDTETSLNQLIVAISLSCTFAGGRRTWIQPRDGRNWQFPWSFFVYVRESKNLERELRKLSHSVRSDQVSEQNLVSALIVIYTSENYNWFGLMFRWTAFFWISYEKSECSGQFSWVRDTAKGADVFKMWCSVNGTGVCVCGCVWTGVCGVP